MYRSRRHVSDIVGLQEDMQRVLGMALEPGQPTPIRRGAWLPALDIFQTDDAITVTVDLPGVKTEDLDLSVEDSILTLRGERVAGSGPDDATYHRIERPFGEFQRAIQLPSKVDADKISASFDGGVLVIRIPLASKPKPRKIAVDSPGE